MAHSTDHPPVTFSTLRRLALALPGVAEGTAYGTPAFRVRGRFLGRLHPDGEAFVLRIDPERRAALVDADPVTFFVTDHYAAHPYVLVRLATVGEAELQALLEAAWAAVAPAALRRMR